MPHKLFFCKYERPYKSEQSKIIIKWWEILADLVRRSPQK